MAEQADRGAQRLEQIGWSSVGCITGGQALAAVSDGRLGSELGVIIAAVCAFVVSFVGLKAVFTYEKFAGLVLAVVFINNVQLRGAIG